MTRLLLVVCVAVLFGPAVPSALAEPFPFDGRTFRGRIAYSADGNFNDPDDWAASPVALATFAEAGVKDRLVHFDYNCFLPKTDRNWENAHAESVLEAAKKYGYDRSVFWDCQRDLDGAVASIARAIDASSADNPLYFIVAGPVEVPYLGIQKSDPQRRRYVWCISHSRWNDGFAQASKRGLFAHNKRIVIESGVNWVQIRDQNGLLSRSPYGSRAAPTWFEPFFWMRDSDDPKVRLLWERMQVSTRPDVSDAGMAYFLVTGDDEADPNKFKRLLDDHIVPAPRGARPHVRLEAENFAALRGYRLEDRNDRNASHRLYVAPAGGNQSGQISTQFCEPYVASDARYDVDLRYLVQEGQSIRFALFIGGAAQGEALVSPAERRGWATHTFRDVPIRWGNQITVEVEGPACLDYVQLNLCTPDPLPGRAGAAGPPATHPRWMVHSQLDDPAAMPGQVIVAGQRPGYLKINGGQPVYLCGPDNPEDFLFLGELNPDGTRSGPQREIIDFLGKSGSNAFHIMMFRMRRCNLKNEGDDTHCPFVDFDPSKPLNQRILDQWEGWLRDLEARGIIVHLEFYNDATDVEQMGWTLDDHGQLHPEERRWIAGIVNRFKHHRNILWGIQESSNKLPRARLAHFKKIAQLIAETDNHNHPIVQSFVTPDTRERDLHPDGVMSDDYRGDPHVGIVTWLHIAPRGNDLEAQHREYLKWALRDRGHFIVMKNETEYQRIDRTTSRRQTWACALAGMHALEAQHNAAHAGRRERILDDGKVVFFMEQTDWHTMEPHDELAAGTAKWVLAKPGESYIAYSYDCSGPMGVQDLAAGTYDLLWFDTVTGRTWKQVGVPVRAGNALWNKPEACGSEVALYVHRSAQGK
ncbi:MAG: hypothetical protein ACUVUC_03630 [Thermoguttaceae bacterium]